MSRVPGTMKQALSEPVRAADHYDPTIRNWGGFQEAAILRNGALIAACYVVGGCSVIVAREPVAGDGSYRWHLSIAHPERYPTWDEIKFARYTITYTKDVPLMVQLLPRVENASKWTNAHENCFHLYEIDAAAYDLEIT